MSFAQAALVEPLSVAAGAVSRASLKLGQPVLVCGAEPIGLAAALCARAAGAHPVCITDLGALFQNEVPGKQLISPRTDRRQPFKPGAGVWVRQDRQGRSQVE